MPDVSLLEHRDTGDQPIATSFRGILRVAGIRELVPETEDLFFDTRYYGQLTGGIASQEFMYDSAYNAISGSLQRYSSSDVYKNCKVPVTDSLGFYLNINMGPDGTTIGSDPTNNGNSLDKETFYQTLSPKEVEQDVIFPVFESKEVFVGFEPIKAGEYKDKVVRGFLSIDTSDTSPASIIFYNNYDNSSENIQDNMFQEVKGTPNRTIIRDNGAPVSDFDVLMHRQDNLDNHNLTSNNTLDAFVEPVNLKEYIKERLSFFQKDNVDEVLTGTIIEQYVDLNKWYCTSTAMNYYGHFPPMNRPDYNGEMKSSLYQNACIKINRISANISSATKNEDKTISTSWEQSQLEEIIPIYKRDYLLCDGSRYYIYLSTLNDVNNANYMSFDMFFNLFFCIEYKYTDRSNIKKHYVNQKRIVNGEEIYEYVLTDGKKIQNTEEIDKEVLFGIDVVSALAFRTIWNNMLYGTDNNGGSSCLNPETNSYDRDMAESWLKKQKIEDQYIFNTPIPSSSGGITYTYVTAPVKEGEKEKEIPLELGREVNSFSSPIWYYDCSTGEYLAVEAWKTAEVQAVLNLFDKYGISREKELKEDFVFCFQVPNFKIDTEKYSVGGMIGSCAYYWSDDAAGATQTASNCMFDDGQIPHRHYIFAGSSSYWSGNTGSVTATTMAKPSGPWVVGIQWEGGWPTDRLYNYIFCEVSGMKYNKEFLSGMNTWVIQKDGTTKPDDPDPRFRNAEPNRGMTSTPIVTSVREESKYTIASNNSCIGSAEFFSPETIQIMPLIKK